MRTAASPQLKFPYDPPPRQRRSRSSRAAADVVEPKVKTRREQVLDYLKGCGDAGATDEEMQARIPMGANTQRPRRVELVAALLVRDSGKTRITSGGDQAVVWITTGTGAAKC